MFTVQPVSNNDDDDTHPINAEFENETQTVHEMTSHDLGNPGDLEQGEGHAIEQIESQCPQPLSQPDETSVQGSYVSLLADIATIEQTDEYSNQPIAHDITDTVDYTATTFTGQDLNPLQNDNMVTYQSIENSSVGCSLANSVGNSQGVQQFVIIQPFLSDTSVNTQNTFIHLPNTVENQLNLDNNKELEDAVANITDTIVAGDTGVVTSEAGSSVDESFLVCTNSRGEVREIQVIQGKQTWTENDSVVPSNRRKGRLKGIDGRQKKGGFTERKESSSHLKKFSMDDLNCEGKSKKEVFEEYLEKSKEKITIESLESKVIESLQESQQNATEQDTVTSNKDCSDNNDHGSEELKSLNELDRGQKTRGKTRILRSRHSSDKVLLNRGKMSNLKEQNKVVEADTSSLNKEKGFTKLKKKSLTLKRKKSVPDVEESCKVSKLDSLDNNIDQIEDKALDNDTESRMVSDLCSLFRSDEKCILHLEPITLKLLSPNRFLTIEMEIEKDFIVSSVEKGESADGLTKYSLKITAPENALQTKRNKTIGSETDHKSVKTNKLKCLKQSRLKSKRTLLKGNKEISGKIIQRPLIYEENMQDNIDDTGMNSHNVEKDTAIEVYVDDSADVGEDNEESICEIKTEISELEIPEDADIGINDNVNDEESKVKDSDSKKKKTKNFTGKKNLKTEQNSTDEKKEESLPNYTVILSEGGKKVYQCILCGKEMSVKQNMDVHINQHTGERPWQCEVCGLGFRGPSNLKAHMHQHDEELRFSCNICFRKFRDRGTYRQHYKRHLGEKKHVCEHCGKSFVITSDLKKHIRTHTGEKPYKCSTCDQQFSDGSSLVRHEKMHAAKFRYECSGCNRQYSRKDLCKKHISKTHVNAREIEINEISIVDDLKQVSKAIKVRNQDSLVVKTQKVTGRSVNREQGYSAKARKLKKSWQNLTEEASKRYKEQSNESVPGTSLYREFPNTIVPAYNIVDYQGLPTFYGNINQKYPEHQKPPVTGYSGQQMVPPAGPLVFQSYIRSLADPDV